MGASRQGRRLSSGRAAALFCAIAVAWWAFDRATKFAVDAGHDVGQLIVPDVLGLFEFRLVHNTGAAWGTLSGATFVLGLFSLAVCVACALYVWYRARRGGCPLGQAIALAFVFAGGLGNAFDRLAYGYVVDFINATFIDFPVFNVADIGVTCGIVVFIALTLFEGEDGEGGEA